MEWYQRDTRFISAQGQPLTILDLCQQRDQDGNRVLRGTRLFLDDLLQKDISISPEQLLRLMENAHQLLQSDDTPFLLGQRLLPGQSGEASHALSASTNLYAALELLQRLQALLSPLLAPVFYTDEKFGYLKWLDSCGSGRLHRHLIEASCVAVAAFSRRQLGQHAPWSFSFRHKKPQYIEQYQVHLGDHLYFEQPCDVMRIPIEYLYRNWQQGTLSSQIANRQADEQLQQLPAQRSLLGTVYELITTALQSPLDNQHLQLEPVARTMGISPATLKRHLKKHGTHFQQQLDQARLHRALYLFYSRRISSEEVARQLGFHDSAGLRRSFKRWTGTTPTHLLSIPGIYT